MHSLPPSFRPSPQQVFPSTPPKLCPPTVKAGCMGNTCPTSDLKHLPEILGGEGGGEGYVLGHPTPYTPRWGHPCVSVTISLSNGETEAQSHPGLPAQTAKRGNLGGYGVGGNGDLLLLLSTRDTTMKDNGQGGPSCIPAAPSWPGRIKHTTAELGTVGRGARGTG